jgi:hypothetical protein
MIINVVTMQVYAIPPHPTQLEQGYNTTRIRK